MTASSRITRWLALAALALAACGGNQTRPDLARLSRYFDYRLERARRFLWAT